MILGKAFYTFLKQAEGDLPILPPAIRALLPLSDGEADRITRLFCRTFFSDHHKRFLVLGINPGRLGAGKTGIAFTDTDALIKHCHFETTIMTTELSAQFIYEFIRQFGGTKSFYSKFLLSSVCPVGFISEGKNYNYYDSADLLKILESYIERQLTRLMELPIHRRVVFCLGKSKNSNYLKNINARLKFFDKIVTLPHPRFVMQYKRKQSKEFYKLYLNTLTSVL